MSQSEYFELVQSLAADLNRKEIQLPSFPDVVVRIRTALDDPDTTGGDLANVLSVDAVLASRVLILANSTYYNPGGIKIEGLEAAVTGELPGIAASVGKAGKRLVSAVEELRKAMDRQVRERQEVALKRVRKTAGTLFPAAAAQERIQTPFAFLAREGSTLIDALDAESSRLLER